MRTPGYKLMNETETELNGADLEQLQQEDAIWPWLATGEMGDECEEQEPYYED